MPNIAEIAPVPWPGPARALGFDGLRPHRAVAAEEPSHRVGVRHARGGVEVGAGPRLGVEVAVSILASHEGGGEAAGTDVAHRRRDVADPDPDAPVSPEIRCRAVQEM